MFQGYKEMFIYSTTVVLRMIQMIRVQDRTTNATYDTYFHFEDFNL